MKTWAKATRSYIRQQKIRLREITEDELHLRRLIELHRKEIKALRERGNAERALLRQAERDLRREAKEQKEKP